MVLSPSNLGLLASLAEKERDETKDKDLESLGTATQGKANELPRKTG